MVRSSVWDKIDDELANDSFWQDKSFYSWIGNHMITTFLDELPYELKENDIEDIGRYIAKTISQD